MSNLVSWIFPFNKPSEERSDFVGGYQYLPAPASQSHIEKDCNPCNREPWIPIASSVGEKTVINFVPPIKSYGHTSSDFSDLSILETLHPPPLSYKPPVGHYRPPPQFRPKDNRINYILPKRPVQPYSPLPNNGDIIVVDYMVPPPVNYRIPSLIYGPPKPLYNPPSRPVYGAPPPNPKPIYSPVPPQFGNNNQYLGQPPPGTTYLNPVSQDFAPPPPPISDLSDVNHQTVAFDEAATDQNAPLAPSDSYGAPVTGDALHYFSPPEQLSLANEHSEYIEKPIPLPNLSSFPVLPFRKYGDFNQNFIHGLENEHTEVKIQESVKIADYLAAIEHPINVIQSPLIELSIKDENYENDKSYGNNGGFVSGSSSGDNNHQTNSLSQEIYPTEGNIYRGEKAQKPYSSINEKLQSVDKSTKLSENPIIVEDVHAAASSNNDTFVNSNEIQIKRYNGKELGTPNVNINDESKTHFKNSLEPLTGTNIIKSLLLDQKVTPETTKPFTRSDHVAINNNFTVPPLDYGNWTPTFGVTLPNLNTFPNSVKFSRQSTTTKKPKLLQIIVPYVTDKQVGSFEDWRNKHGKSQIPNYTGAYSTLLPVFSPPETTQVSLWSKYSTIDLKPATPTPIAKVTTGVYNIKELLSDQRDRLPYDIISLQKHIDNWTQQAYSLSLRRDKLSTPKEIPSEYFTTQDPNTYSEVTTIRNQLDYNNLKSPTQRQMDRAEDRDIDSNLVIPTETTTERYTTTTKLSTTLPSEEHNKSSWNTSHVTVSPQSKEKVYIVTPQTYSYYTSTPATAWSSAPRVKNGKVNNGSTYDSYKFSIRVEPQHNTTRETLKREDKGAVKIVYSEWPHLSKYIFGENNINKHISGSIAHCVYKYLSMSNVLQVINFMSEK